MTTQIDVRLTRPADPAGRELRNAIDRAEALVAEFADLSLVFSASVTVTDQRGRETVVASWSRDEVATDAAGKEEE